MRDSLFFVDSLKLDSIGLDSLSCISKQIDQIVLPMIERTETIASSSWFGILLLSILIALAISLSVHRKQYTLLLRNVLNKEGRIMSYDSEHTEVWANILLGIVVLMSHSLCIYCIAQIKLETMLPLWVFLAINLVIFLILFVKTILINIIGYIFSQRKSIKTFITDYFVIFSVLGLLLIPCAIAMVYSPINHQTIWIFVVFVFYILAFLSVLTKLIQIFYEGISSLFYIFLYLCTLEILPISMVLKAVSELINKV